MHQSWRHTIKPCASIRTPHHHTRCASHAATPSHQVRQSWRHTRCANNDAPPSHQISWSWCHTTTPGLSIVTSHSQEVRQSQRLTNSPDELIAQSGCIDGFSPYSEPCCKLCQLHYCFGRNTIDERESVITSHHHAMCASNDATPSYQVRQSWYHTRWRHTRCVNHIVTPSHQVRQSDHTIPTKRVNHHVTPLHQVPWSPCLDLSTYFLRNLSPVLKYVNSKTV